jgi:hypothetical protein
MYILVKIGSVPDYDNFVASSSKKKLQALADELNKKIDEKGIVCVNFTKERKDICSSWRKKHPEPKGITKIFTYNKYLKQFNAFYDEMIKELLKKYNAASEDEIINYYEGYAIIEIKEI